MILPAISNLDYQAVFKSVQENTISSFSAYAGLRSLLILGKKEEALSFYEGHKDDFGAFKTLANLVSDLFLTGSKEQIIAGLQGLNLEVDEEAQNEYLQGEINFLSGYTLNLMNQYKRSLPYHEAAIGHYQKAGLKGPMFVSMFNKAVALNHLGLWLQSDQVLSNLKDQKELTPKLQLPLGRLELYRFINQSEFAKAKKLTEELLELCLKTDRDRDYAELLCFDLYLNIKLGEVKTGKIQPLGHSHQENALKAYEELRFTSLLTIEEFNIKFEKLIQSEINDIDKLFIMDLLVDRVRYSGDYEQVFSAVQKCKEFSIKSQQNIGLVDFRLIEAEALLGLGEAARAVKTANSYLLAAKLLNSKPREKKAQDFLDFCQGFSPIQEVTIKEKNTFVINLHKEEVSLGDQSISLKKSPTCFKLIQSIARQKQGVSLDKIFKEIYQTEFNPASHQEQLNSLIARTRKILKPHKCVLRRSNMLLIDPEWQISIQEDQL